MDVNSYPLFMKSNQKPTHPSAPSFSGKTRASSSAHAADLAENIGKKLLEIKRISGEGEMTELNLALWRHLK
jgi:hypothetical protein